MILERPYAMPYAYLVTAEVRRKRSIARRSFAMTGHVEAMVKEVSASDAPVVLSWNVNDRSSQMRHEVRFFDGSFYVPAMAMHDVFPVKYVNEIFGKKDLPSAPGVRSSMHAKLTNLSKARFDTPGSQDESIALQRVLREGFFIPAVLDSDVERVVESSEEDRRAAAAKLLEDVLVVRRDLWIRVSEPRFLLRRPEPTGDGDNYKPSADIYFGPTGAGDPLYPTATRLIGGPLLSKFYSPTDLVAFDDDAASEGVDYDFKNIVVHDPSVFTIDWDLNARARLVDFAVRSLAPEIGNQSASTAIAFLDARDAVIRFHETGERSVIDEAVETHLPMLVASFEGKADTISEVLECLSHFGKPDVPSLPPTKGPGR
ncbi:hypothetical protein HFN89_01175 [Rhizobium laguerreae]|nr:hypothetical protein [Rhizobium laguerreae]